MATKKAASGQAQASVEAEKIQNMLAAQIKSAPTFYADSLFHLSIGPFTGKLALGTISPINNEPSDVLNVVMPTNALVDLLTNVAKILIEKNASEQIKINYDNLLKKLDNIRVEIPGK